MDDRLRRDRSIRHRNGEHSSRQERTFQHWLYTDGKQVSSTDEIYVSKCDKVTASIEYEIYIILINTDAGVESIAIDGNLMIGESEAGISA